MDGALCKRMRQCAEKLTQYNTDDYILNERLVGANPFSLDDIYTHKLNFTSHDERSQLEKINISDYDKIQAVLSQYAGESSEWCHWTSETLPEDLSLPMTKLPPCKVVQSFVIGVNLPPFVLTCYEDTSLETEIREYSKLTANMLRWRLLEFCHLDFLLLPCIVTKNFDIEALKNEIMSLLKNMSQCFGGTTHLKEDTFQTMKEATTALAGSTSLPCLLQTEERTEGRQHVMGKDWRNLLSLLIEMFSSGKKDGDSAKPNEIRPRTDAEFKVKVAVIEAVKRIGLRNSVVVTSSVLDKELSKYIRELNEEIRKRYTINHSRETGNMRVTPPLVDYITDDQETVAHSTEGPRLEIKVKAPTHKQSFTDNSVKNQQEETATALTVVFSPERYGPSGLQAESSFTQDKQPETVVTVDDVAEDTEMSEVPSSVCWNFHSLSSTNNDGEDGDDSGIEENDNESPPNVHSKAAFEAIDSSDSVSKSKSSQASPLPIFSPTWCTSVLFSEEGGRLQTPSSDVVLNIPRDAVVRGSVTIDAATCTDVDFIRRTLKLEKEEQVVSPLAEYYAGPGFRFRRPVTITFPHFLPRDFDPDCVRVVHVTRDKVGDVAVTRLDHKQDKPVSQWFLDETTKGDPSGLYNRSSGQFIVGETHITLFTDHFSGYVCTYCHKESKYRPELYMMGSVYLSSPSECNPRVDVHCHVWDKKISLADFRQEYDIKAGPYKYIQLLQELQDTKLEIRMRANVPLTHRLNSRGQPLCPGEPESIALLPRFGCQKCARKGQLFPTSHQWAMECPPDRPLNELEVALIVTHTTDCDTPFKQAHTTLLLTVSDGAFKQVPQREHKSAFTQTDTEAREEPFKEEVGKLQNSEFLNFGLQAEHLELPDHRHSPLTYPSTTHERTQDQLHTKEAATSSAERVMNVFNITSKNCHVHTTGTGRVPVEYTPDPSDTSHSASCEPYANLALHPDEHSNTCSERQEEEEHSNTISKPFSCQVIDPTSGSPMSRRMLEDQNYVGLSWEIQHD